MKFVNLTGSDVTIIKSTTRWDPERTHPKYPGTKVFRFFHEVVHSFPVDGPKAEVQYFCEQRYGSYLTHSIHTHDEVAEAVNLPDTVIARDEDTQFIVTDEVRRAFPFRHDLVSPHDPVKDEDGTFLGYTRFTSNSHHIKRCNL
jgi:hypothetical protein